MKLQDIINTSDNIVFFGGAGVSTGSGIPDFRGKNGLYTKDIGFSANAETMLNVDFFLNKPEEFYKFFKKYFFFNDSKPNDTHKKLVELEESGKLKAIITQNIDGLHQEAGSKNVLEVHGSTKNFTCLHCNSVYKAKEVVKNTHNLDELPKCTCGKVLKPAIILYGEPLDNKVYDDSVALIENCDTLIIGGTSLEVFPAARLIDYFTGKNLVLINETDVKNYNTFTLTIKDDICNVFKKININ